MSNCPKDELGRIANAEDARIAPFPTQHIARRGRRRDHQK
jgi:hypothetical protein